MRDLPGVYTTVSDTHHNQKTCGRQDLTYDVLKKRTPKLVSLTGIGLIRINKITQFI